LSVQDFRCVVGLTHAIPWFLTDVIVVILPTVLRYCF